MNIYFLIPIIRLRVSVFSLPAALLIMYTEGFLSASIIILASLLHESGHFIAIRLCGAEIERVDIEPLGARITYRSEYTSFADDVRIALGGVTVNCVFIVAGALAFGFVRNELVLLFTAANTALALINLLPIRFLDGGRALYSLLCIKKDADTAWKICSAADTAGKLLLIAVNFGLCVISGFNLGITVLFVVQVVGLFCD